jgi:hypothetical protein
MRRLALLVTLLATALCAVRPLPAQAPGAAVWRVTLRAPGDVTALTSGAWDVLEARGPDYLLILGDSATAEALRRAGYRVALDQAIDLPASHSPLAYYGGYRTAVEHDAHLAEVAAAYPHLVRLVDYGDSWRKTQGRADGSDLLAVCLTRLRPGDCELSPDGDKPRLLVVAGLHARELSPPEVAWRWIDWLLAGYGADPDVTLLLDWSEVWVAPLANPDGRRVVEQGGDAPLLQRKNANTSYAACSLPYIGVDLNRNAGFQWGGTGASAAACNQLYRGPAADSEPETTALQGLMRGLFRDQRGPAVSDAAPVTATGVMLSLHSYGNLVMLPWDWTTARAPNDAALRSLAFRMSAFNRYAAGSSPEVLYVSSGTVEDWAYGVLGVPSFTFEIGSSFLPSYGLVDGEYWPRNRGALLYAAQVARQPYALALGPAPVSLTLSLAQTAPGQAVTLTAAFDDRLYGTSGVGRPASQAISQAEVYAGAPPWSGGAPLPMRAADGAFNAVSERAVAELESGALGFGRHLVMARAQDAGGAWGPLGAAWLTVIPTATRVVTGAVTDRATGAPVGALVRGTGEAAGLEPAEAVADPATGHYSLTLAAGAAYALTITAEGYLPAWGRVEAGDGELALHFALTPLAAAWRVWIPVVELGW